MFVKRLLVIAVASLVLLSACTPEHSKIIVAEFDKTPITMGEFEASYSKNLGGPGNVKNDSLEALKKFLDLYVNYKMKLRDAFVRGYTIDEDMQKEIIEYKANIGSTLFLENNLYDPSMRNMYEKRKLELRVSHIFITPDSTMNETQCYNFCKQLIDSAKNGSDFSLLAKKYSKDNYTKDKGGDVYYFTAGQVAATNLEDAVYSMNVGEVFPEPINSGFGFHVIKLTDKKERVASVNAQHILVSLRDSTGKPLEDTLKAYQKALDIKKKLDQGEDFGKLAETYSDDKGTAKKQGELGPFSRGRMVREFDEAAFNLKKGEISPLVKTQFGYHIIKLMDVKPNPAYEEEKESLRDILKKSRFKKEYADLVEKLKKQFGFKKDEATMGKIIANLDSLKIGKDYWSSSLQSEIGNLELFSINNHSYNADSLFRYMQNKNISLGLRMDPKALSNAYDQFEGEVVIKEKGLMYDKEDVEFAKLMKEYEDGVYLFKILEDEVWSKVSVDSSAIVKYWDENKNNFKWNDRIECKDISVKDDTLINKIYKLVTNGKDFDSLAASYNVKGSSKEILGLVEIKTNVLTQQANFLKNIDEVSKPFPYQDGWAIVKLINREPARIKTFDEAKAEVSSAVQEIETKRLESEYVNKLKSIYRPNYYYDELQKAFKN